MQNRICNLLTFLFLLAVIALGLRELLPELRAAEAREAEVVADSLALQPATVDTTYAELDDLPPLPPAPPPVAPESFDTIQEALPLDTAVNLMEYDAPAPDTLHHHTTAPADTLH